MITDRAKVRIYVFGIATALALALIDSARGGQANDVYGPLPPPGFVAPKADWWASLKAKVNDKISQFKNSRFRSAPAAPTEQAMGRAANATQAEPAYSLAPVRKVGAPVQSQPALVLPRTRTVHAPLPIPTYVLRPTQPVLDVQALPALAEVKQRKQLPEAQYVVQKAERPRALANPPPTLVAYSGQPIAKVERLSSDALILIEGLLSWLHDKHDDAVKTLHALGTSSKSPHIRQKALAFTGWILEQRGLESLGALALWRALSASPGDGESRSYDNDAAETLSDMVTRSASAKAWFDAEAASKIVESRNLKADAAGFLTLLMAEHAFDKRSYAQARRLAQSVPSKAKWREQARYLAATAIFSQKDSKENLDVAGRELTELFRSVDSSEVFDATAVTLGRIHFILGNYKAAHKYLSQVSRDTNMFIESAIDNSWALLRAGDRNHAVGNMFTLHTSYFEGAYMPDSYFLQSLGYQEICQFGDALTAVKQYKTRYAEAYKRLIEFNAAGKAAADAYYDELTAYLGRKDHQLPPIVLRELGRHPQFLRRQKILNGAARDERNIATLLPQSAPALSAWAAKPIEKVRASLKSEIAGFLKSRAATMEDELKFVTANMSLLEYEIFAGASSNLALQGAKNFAIDEKTVPKRDFQLDKEYWPYEDEIWEDELNNFRSKMVDACAKRKLAGEQS